MRSDKDMSFMEHLEELRSRLIRCVIAILVGMVICWMFREELLAFLLDPLYSAWRQVDGLPEPQPLNFTGLLEPFVAYLKLSALGGLFVAMPVVLYQFWKFVAPGLYKKERRYAAPFVVVSSILFVGGSAMAYQIVFPIGFRFFLEFAAGVDHSTYEAAPAALTLEPTPSVAKTDAKTSKPSKQNAKKGKPAAEKRSAKPGSKPSSVSEPAESEAWYEWLWGRLISEDCGDFTASLDPKGERARLMFKWHKTRCGSLPEMLSLSRNGATLTPSWSEVQEVASGHVVMTSWDQNPGKTPVYKLITPSRSDEHRLVPVLMVKDFLAFAIRLLLAFGLIFELPILITFLSIAGLVNYRQLLSFSRWFVVIAVALGAMLTPPDVVTQLLLAAPLIILYFVSVFVAFLFGPRPEPRD